MTLPRSNLRILLGPAGSAGDVHPFVALGKALRGRGHEVIVITSPVFQELVERVGLQFAPVGTVEGFHAALRNRKMWHPARGFPTVMKYVLQLSREAFETVASLHEPGRTVMASAMLGVGARLAQEKLGIPMASIHLQPAVFLSAEKPPALPMRIPRWWPLWLRRAAMGTATGVVERAVGPALNDLRRDLYLPAARPPITTWIHSPQLVIGLFPEWYAEPQSDWPPNTHLTGFLLYDEADVTEMPEEAEAFLAEGEPPIVFTPGSANLFGREFFEAGVEACERLGRQGMLLTRHAEQVPASLPPTVRHFDYLPFSALLPRAAALVYHGGIGTLAQGLSAGVPHLVMPMSHDQPDNAARLEELGVGRGVPPKRFRGPRVAETLGKLIDSAEVATRCGELARKVREGDPVARTCELIEGLAVAGGASA